MGGNPIPDNLDALFAGGGGGEFVVTVPQSVRP